MNNTNIESAAQFLIEILKRETSVRFSRFYNAIPGLNEVLLRDMRVSLADGDCGDYGTDHSAAWLIECAIIQLEEQHIVTRRPSDGMMIDGEADYEVGLSIGGRKKLEAGIALAFHEPHNA